MQSFLEILGRTQLRNKISQLRRVSVEFAKHCGDRPDEHARVPSEISFSQKRFGQIEIRFFPKAQHPMNTIFVRMLRQMDGLPLLDVTKSGTCPAWLDADRYKTACFLGCLGCQSERFLKGILVRNQMIGRKKGHDGCAI